MKMRTPKPDDQEKADKACKMLKYLIDCADDIDINIWFGAFLSTICSTYKQNGFSHKEWDQEMQKSIKFYEHWWKEEEN